MKLKHLCIMVALIVLLVSCGGKESSTSGGSGGSSGSSSKGSSSTSSAKVQSIANIDDGSETFTYDWIIGHWATPPDPDGVVIKEIEEKWNIKLNIQWIPNGALKEKISLLINSGDYPDACTLPQSWIAPDTPPEYETWADEEFFVDLKPYIEELAPNLVAQIPQRQFDLGVGLLYGEPSGAYYALPQVAEQNYSILFVRQDWLDKFGMDIPTTLDEWYAYWRACSYNDPDGNGKQDTYGYYLANDGMSALEPLLAAFDLLPNYPYRNSNGEFIPYNLTDRYFEALAYVNKMWNEKLIDPSSVALSGGTIAKERFDTNKLGTLRAGTNNFIWRLNFLNQGFPEATMAMSQFLSGSDGVFRATETYSFHRSTALFYPVEEDDPARVARFVKMWNWLISPEGQDLITWGIEGIHYTEDTNGKRTATPKWETDNINNIRVAVTTDPLGTNPIPRYLAKPEEAAYQIEAYEEILDHIVTNPIITLSKTEAELNQLEYITYETEMLFNMATGKTPITPETIADYRKTWLKKGGQQYLDEWQTLVAEKETTPEMQEWLELLGALEKNW